jgi:hypothetical protein
MEWYLDKRRDKFTLFLPYNKYARVTGEEIFLINGFCSRYKRPRHDFRRDCVGTIWPMSSFFRRQLSRSEFVIYVGPGPPAGRGSDWTGRDVEVDPKVNPQPVSTTTCRYSSSKTSTSGFCHKYLQLIPVKVVHPYFRTVRTKQINERKMGGSFVWFNSEATEQI